MTSNDLVFVPITPCRIVETRTLYGGTGPLAQGSVTAFDAVAPSFAAQGGSATDCGIPTGAGAIAVTIGMLNTSDVGDVRVWPVDATMPNASTGVFSPSVMALNPEAGQVAVNGASAIIQLCQTGCTGSKEFQVRAEHASLDLTVDVTGYFHAAPVAANGAGQGLNWGIIARNVIGSATAFLRNDGTAPSGTGSLEISVGAGTDKVEFGDQVSFAGQALSAINDIGYVVKTTGENSQTPIVPTNGTVNMPAIALELWTSGTVGVGYSTLNYSPNVNSTANVWSGYIDAANDASNAWGLTGSAFNSPATSANCGINGPRCTYAQIKTLLPNAILISAGISKGRDYAWHGEVDSLRIGGTTYDFEAQGVNSIATP